MTNFTKCLLFFVLLLAGCTTERPLTAKEVEQALRDTLVIKQIPINPFVSILSALNRQRDTVIIERTTHVETATNTSSLDTALLGAYMERYHGNYAVEIAGLQSTIKSLQALIIKDGERTLTQHDYDTTRQRERDNKDMAEALPKVYDFTKIIFAIIASLLILFWLTSTYFKRKLRERQAQIASNTH